MKPASDSASDSASELPASELPVYDMAEVSKHNTMSDCWIGVNGQVLNVTKFLPGCPCGEFKIMCFAGKDASEEFNKFHGPGVISVFAPDAIIGRLPDLRLPGSASSSAGFPGFALPASAKFSMLASLLEDVELDVADELPDDEDVSADYIEAMKDVFEVAKMRAEQAAQDLVKANKVKREIGEHLAKILKKQRAASLRPT